MKIESRILKMVDSTNDNWLATVSEECASIIKNKLAEIPTEFFEPRISLDFSSENKISLVEFSMQTAGMSKEKKDGLMDRYHINPHDMNKLQRIIDSIKVAREYGIKNENKNIAQDNRKYGFALSNEQNIDKAYPLWLAYLYSDSKNPMEDIKNKLHEDKMEGKYEPEYIISLMKHTDMLMEGKSSDEKKDFYIQTISGILEDKSNNIEEKIDIEI